LKLTLLYREDCGLCDEMLLELEQFGQRVPLPPVQALDVDSDPELARRHGLHIPVLLLDGTVVCRTRLDADELARLLRVKPR
jgi:thiol-disulfide isomerase/thioredoxin